MGLELQKRDPQTYAIIGAAMAVHRELGAGFAEGVYQEVMEIELAICGVGFEAQKELKVMYKGRTLKCEYKPDFICFDDIVVEIKALGHELTGSERAQLMNYLKATGIRRGLLINFGLSSLKYERMGVGEELPMDADLD
jgi:GxxExxY protein